ncbi:hypothetical protein BAUCODRAFT_96705 [Baudoinia panamericana UAMH 10762]|uniref:SAM-dependent MTase RsmB/NOP-type domain-containing protein n=1 Tax=Baudoinia panamericana (strain UAMH 10762) TaxID=717646 RepID=M2M6Z1_BAUPA|nr:uncharacterized protein BAUCODRAFT_96705 [Baudoinia panamericana UAMH 10762]EMC92041.1 hypothetical protein BAUCODRAFT_96705 [Baudoinia panamericana UAMH 10762]
MSLYHEAAKILDDVRGERVSIKSLVYGRKDWKTDSKTLFALATEAAKWSKVLSEVLERSGVLKVEKQLKPTLAVVLVHDLFLSKRGIALPASHGLNLAVSKHKVRLSAELTKARLRRGFATLDALRASINGRTSGPSGSDSGLIPENSVLAKRPRWIRINTLKTTLAQALASTFAEYEQVSRLSDVLEAPPRDAKILHIDEHIPDLIAISVGIDLTTSKAYRAGELILQDKASCFPAYLLDPQPGDGDVIDACAAPGNKTTHLAALSTTLPGETCNRGSENRVIACEKDATRSETLRKMLLLAGADRVVSVKARQDFMKMDPTTPEFANVKALLLDPSCSGSGIVGRDGVGIPIHLPNVDAEEGDTNVGRKRSKKRKRGRDDDPKTIPSEEDTAHTVDMSEEQPNIEEGEKLKSRLANLSAFQLRLLEHAMSFPTAQRITYSTCSIHAEENEHVVIRALYSAVARKCGWRIMKRHEQVEGMQRWHLRGHQNAVGVAFTALANEPGIDAEPLRPSDVAEVAEACIRCDKNGKDGTMGFFVAGFVRDVGPHLARLDAVHETAAQSAEADVDDWSGFDGD